MKRTDLKKRGIYSITNKINGKRYIGQTGVSFSKRWKSERYSLRKNLNCPNKHIQAAWNKYGEENFKFEIIEIVEDLTKKILTEKEQYWSDFYKTNNKNYGYNKRQFVETCLGFKFSDEERKHLSIVRKGKKQTQEVKEKISNSWTDERKKNKSIQICGEKNPNFNIALRDEEKIKKLYYDEKMSQTEIANLLNTGQSSISRIIRGKKTIRKGKKIIEV